jgi:hypothetical protein
MWLGWFKLNKTTADGLISKIAVRPMSPILNSPFWLSGRPVASVLRSLNKRSKKAVGTGSTK